MTRAAVSHEICLYRHFDDDGRLLYVGISSNCLMRLNNHRYLACWYPQISTVTIERYPTRTEAKRAEQQAICSERPIYNVVHSRNPPPQALRSYGRSGRPALGLVETKIRLPVGCRERITALVGAQGMARFIREAVEEALVRREKRQTKEDRD